MSDCLFVSAAVASGQPSACWRRCTDQDVSKEAKTTTVFSL